MEQNIVDSSKYALTIHSLDTRYADSITRSHSEFRVQPPNPLKNIVRIRLSSIELPLVEYTFSASKGNDSFRVFVANSTIPITIGPISPGNYTGGTLVQTLQTLLQNINSGFVCNLNGITGLVTITNTTVKFTIHFASSDPSIASRNSDWGLGYNLGFRQKIITASPVFSLPGSFAVTGTSVINCQASAYYLLQLNAPDSMVNVYHRLANESYVEAFAKLVLDDGYYQIQFDNGSNLLRKEISFLSPITVPFFQVKLLDSWGKSVNMLGADWSLSLELTEVVNSKTYNTMLKGFER